MDRLACFAECTGFAHAVPMGETAVEHICQDFHIAMGVCSEAPSRRDSIVIDDAQRTETHMRRIMVAGERKGVVTIDPAQIGMPTLSASANSDHSLLSLPLLGRGSAQFTRLESGQGPSRILIRIITSSPLTVLAMQCRLP